MKAVTRSKQNKKILVFSAVFEMTLESNHAISFVNGFDWFSHWLSKMLINYSIDFLPIRNKEDIGVGW